MWVHLLLLSSLTGTVLDEKNRPIEGALVALIPRAHGEEPKTGASDANGRFEVVLPGSGAFRVEAYAPGCVPFKAGDVDPTKPLTIVLKRGGETIAGVVRDGATLDPLEGAIVETRTGEYSARVSAEPRLGLVDAVSDERGEFRLEGLAKTSYTVSASAPGYGRTTKMNVAPEAAVEFYLFPGSGVYGRLLDEKGEPVEGALVSAEGGDRSFPRSAQRSDAEGRFAVLGLEPGEYRLFVRHDDFAPAAHEVEVTKDSDTELELVLTPGVTLTGRLLNENDDPVAGKVSLRSLDGFGVSALIRARMTAESDAEGFFSLASVPTGDHTLLAEARGYGSKNVEDLVSGKTKEEDLGDIVVEIGLSISGRVLDENGNPVVSAVVSAAQPARGTMSSAGDLFVVANADEEGRFVLAGLSPGAHHLTASAPGFGNSERVMAEPGASNVTLTLQLTGSIRGTAVDPEGRPVTSFQATARSSERRGIGWTSVQDGEGAFVLDDVAAGEYAVEIDSRDFLPEVISSVRVSGGNVTEVGTIRLRRGGSIVGTVVDTSAEPVPAATIQAIVAGSRAYSMMEGAVSSDQKGRFQIRGLMDGKIAVVATHPGYAETRVDGIEVDSTAGASEVEIVLRRGGALEGVVRTRDGTDIAGRTIQVHPQGRPYHSMERGARTSEDGSFRIEHLPAGKLTAALQHTEGDAMYTVQSREVDIAEGETTYVEFQSRRVAVQGQVRRGGSPLSGVEIQLWPEGPGFSAIYGGGGDLSTAGPRHLIGVSGEDGYYELLVDQPGEYRVDASAYGIGLPSRTVTIPDVDSLSLDLDFGGALVSGRVIDKKTEAPVAGAFVEASSTKLSAGATGAGLEVGADGLFDLELEPGEFAIVVRAEGYATAMEKVAVEQGGRSDLVFALSSGRRITGRILDASGRGVGNLQVMSLEDSPDISTPPMHRGFARTIPDGSFSLDDLAQGRYNVFAGNSLVGFAFVPSVPSGTEDLELALRPGGKVEVLVVDGEGTPVANAIAVVAAIDGRKVRFAQGTADGGGRLELVAPRGNLTIKAVVPDGPDGMATVAVSENATARVEIVLAQTANSLSKK